MVLSWTYSVEIAGAPSAEGHDPGSLDGGTWSVRSTAPDHCPGAVTRARMLPGVRCGTITGTGVSRRSRPRGTYLTFDLLAAGKLEAIRGQRRTGGAIPSDLPLTTPKAGHSSRVGVAALSSINGHGPEAGNEGGSLPVGLQLTRRRLPQPGLLLLIGLALSGAAFSLRRTKAW